MNNPDERTELGKAVTRMTRPPGVKRCPFTGGTCTHRPESYHGTVVKCWARESHIDNQPDGLDGRHKDSMG